jgi:hypothetical protein
MGMSELPQGAVEAAAEADYGMGWDTASESTKKVFLDDARLTLAAAYPYLAAQTLRDAADDLDLPGSTATGYYSSNDESGYREAEAYADIWLRDRADRIEAP